VKGSDGGVEHSESLAKLMKKKKHNVSESGSGSVFRSLRKSGRWAKSIKPVILRI
jgi:hypothetical protein